MRLELLDRYLVGDCTAAERASVEAWLAEEPARRVLLELLVETGPQVPDALKAEIRARLAREMDQGYRLGGGNGV
jgi:anti-sigma factor RsiW